MARFGAGAGLLGVVIWRLGTEPVFAGVGSLTVGSLLAATALTYVATLCAAWRWTIVARGLGVPIPLRTAVAAYYRSQLINTTLPGGVVGDVQRGIRHGRESDDLSGGLRAVAWERISGQLVQCTVAVLVLVLVPSRVRSFLPLAVGALAASALLISCWLIGSRQAPSRLGRLLRRTRDDIRAALLRRQALPALISTSLVVVAAHATTLIIAMRTTGTRGPLVMLALLAMIMLVSSAIPLNIGGWGPRETAAVWAYSATGLAPADGLAAAAAYGALTVLATLPAVVLIAVSKVASIRGSSPACRDRKYASAAHVNPGAR